MCEASYNPTDLVQRAWRQPPRCLSEVLAKPMPTPPAEGAVFDELAYFVLSCHCGHGYWRVFGYPHPEANLLCPVRLECTQCKRSALVFDIELHGYDAELGHGSYSMRAEGAEGTHLCSRCGSDAFEVFPGFSYQFDDFDEWPEDEQQRVQDLFDVFCLLVRCLECQSVETPVDYECA